MDASQFSRWTRFAKKGGIGKCVALKNCAAEHPGDLMFFEGDEITVLMQLSDEDGLFLGYCEGVVGRFTATYVQFTGKLKTPIISKRSSSTSKSPRPRSLTPSHKQHPSQSPVPGPSRPSSREEVFPPDPHDASSPPFVPVPNPPPLAHRQSSETSSNPSHLDLLVTPSMTYSSPSSVQDSASPPTPSEPYLEPHLKYKTRPPLVLDSPLITENGQSTLFSAINSLLLPSPQKPDNPEALRPSKPGPAPAGDPLGIACTTAQSSGTPPSGPLYGPQPPSSSTSSESRVGVGDASSICSSRHSTAMSDAGAGIGLSMLQDFLPDNGGEEGEDDELEDGEDSDHDSSSQSERGRTSLEETVDGFPAPPTQIPTPSSRATSFILDPRRPISSVSEDSEDGDGASFYDNYRYSRLSISSKMSKSSGYTLATIPPPIPTELPPPVRSHSRGSQSSVPTQFSEPLSSSSEPSSSTSPPPREASPTAATQATTGTIPPPLTLESSEKDLEPSNSNLVTAMTSPLLHGNFRAPHSPPSHPNSPTKRSPVGPAPALRQKEQSVVEDSHETDVPAGIRGKSPQPPIPLVVATALGSSIASTTLEKKRRDGPPPFIVMNPTPPPPPYTLKAPLLLETTSTPSTPTHTAMPTSAIPHIPSLARAIPGAMAEQTTTNVPQPRTTPNGSNLFLPHPNAPKPNSSPQAPLYGRGMSSAPLLPSTLLIQTMRRAAQIRVGPNGLPRFCTIYGSTARDLSTAVGPVLIYFSLDPPNDIPTNRMLWVAPTPALAPALAPVPVPAPAPTAVTVPPHSLPPPARVPTSNKISHSSFPAAGSQQPFPGQPGQRQGAGATTDVIPRPGFVPKAGAVRPRSRSFSGFDSAMDPETQSKEQSRDTKTGSRPSTADSVPSSSPRVSRLAARAAAHTARIHQSRQYTPSPLSLSQSTTRSNSSPLATSLPISPSTSSHPVPSPTSPTLRRRLTPVKSEPSLRSAARKPVPKQEHEAPVPASVPALASAPQSSVSKLDGTASSRVPALLPSTARMNMPPSIRISSSDSQALSSHSGPGNEAAFLRSRPRRQSSDSPRHNSSTTAMDVDGSSSHPSDLRTQVPLPPSASAPSAPLLGRSGSLRSKISLSALRARSARDDDGSQEPDTVQVKDTDFELVRPTVRPRVSEDSAINGKSSGSEGRPSFLRIDSPAMSTTSGGGTSDTRSPVSPLGMSLPPVTASAASSVGTAVEAHRARELKWISVMSTTPPSQARKGKKIRKLLQEGVPASVRYQVWAHLTDSKAKRIEGLYAQFGEREKVSAYAEIQRDAQVCFAGDSRLSLPNGPLVSLLQAYLTMVPDIQYSKGLTFIAGQLLLQSPEEDAFWIFISLMDSHLRPYFSSNAVQLDIDASLFAKALEMVDPSIAKKLFVDMAIPPIRVCRPWFSSLFVEALPTEYFQRVWDIFLSEGMVFLIRIGLAIMTCCHRTLLEVHQQSEVLKILTRPPPFLISSSPETLIELANSFRIKDDNIRKQRVKLEAQMKLRTQSRLSGAARKSGRNSNGGGDRGDSGAVAAISLPTRS